MKINKERIHENRVKCKNTLQITLDDDFNVPDSKADIDVIIKEWGNPRVDSVKVNSDRAEVKGCLDFAFVYCGNDESSQKVMPYKMAGSMNFDENINLSEDSEGTYVTCDARLEDLTVKAINSRKVSVKAIVALTVTCEELEELEVGSSLADEEAEQQLQVLGEDISYTELAVNLRDNLRIRENIQLPQGKPNVGEVIWDEAAVRMFNSRLTDDGLQVNGELGIFMMYLPQEENQPVQWFESAVSFEGKLDINGCSADMISFVQYKTISFNLEVRPDYDGENRDISVEMVLDLSVRGFEERQQQIITDMYSPVRNITLNTQPAKLKKLLVRNNAKCRTSQRVKVGDYLGIMQICSCSGTAQIDDITVEDDGLLVDGAILANLFYVTADDAVPMGGLKAVVPFSHKLQLKTCENMDYTVNAYVEQLGAVMTGKDVIEIKGSVAIDAVCFENYELSVAEDCQIEDFDEKEYLKLPCIVGYISDGREMLWEIAKKFHTTVDQIRSDNSVLPDMCDEKYRPKKGEKLLLVKAAR